MVGLSGIRISNDLMFRDFNTNCLIAVVYKIVNGQVSESFVHLEDFAKQCVPGSCESVLLRDLQA